VLVGRIFPMFMLLFDIAKVFHTIFGVKKEKYPIRKIPADVIQ
jgi:hypothetical protein